MKTLQTNNVELSKANSSDSQEEHKESSWDP